MLAFHVNLQQQPCNLISSSRADALLCHCRHPPHPPPSPAPPTKAPIDGTPPSSSSSTPQRKQQLVVFVMGATGTGKSRLAIDLARRLDGEVINSDKMQVYDALDVVTNKVTADERAAVPHHLLGGIHPDAEFTAADFRRAASRAVEGVLSRGRLPVVAGGSNSYIAALVDGEDGMFRSRYDCCFIWVDVELPVLHGFVEERVERMVEMGMVEEVRGVFVSSAGDYTRGVRRSIGVPEMHDYLTAEAAGDSAAGRLDGLLAAAIEEIKANNRKLTCCQLEKIRRLQDKWGNIRRFDATKVFENRGGGAADCLWEELVASPCVEFVRRRRYQQQQQLITSNGSGAAVDRPRRRRESIAGNPFPAPTSIVI